MHHALGSFSVDLGPNEIGEPNVRSGETWTRGSNVSKWPKPAVRGQRSLSDRRRPGGCFRPNRGAMGPRNRETSYAVLGQAAGAVAVYSDSLGSSSYHTKSPTISSTALPTTKGSSGLLEPNSNRS
jgi:hypothetical protein